MAPGPEAFAGLHLPETPRGLDFFGCDLTLHRLLRRRAPAVLARHGEALRAFGAWAGGPLDEQAANSDRHAPPRLEPYGRFGARLGRVVHNPAYNACHQEAYRRGTISLCYGKDPAPHLLSFLFGYLLSQADISIHCPVTMTGAVAFVLAHHAPAGLRRAYLPGLTARAGPVRTAATWVTERQGGSDVGAAQTEARPEGGGWKLYGEKWFASNAGADLALVIARQEGAPAGGRGLGCYLVETGQAEDGAKGVWVRRLKDKLGTRGLATGEIEFDGAAAEEVTPPPDGLKTMMQAIGYSRLHNAFAAVAVERRALLEALCWAAGREAFGGPLAGYPLVRETLLDLLARLEGDLCLSLEAGLAFDAALAEPDRRPWLRLVTALAKYRTAQSAVRAAAEALELVGGNGYTEDWATARLYRDAMVLPVWEGPGNIQALEVLRLLAGAPAVAESFAARLAASIDAAPPALADSVARLGAAREGCLALLQAVAARPEDGPRHARRLIEALSGSLSAALLLEEATHALAASDERPGLLARWFLARLSPAGPADPALDTALGPAFAAIVAGAVGL